MQGLSFCDRFWGWLAQTSWQAAVLVLLILVAQFLLRHRISAAWRHGLWLLLVARLLMPAMPGSAVSIFNLTQWPRAQRDAAAGVGIRGGGGSKPGEQMPLTRGAPIAVTSSATARAPLWWYVALGWVAGVLILALRFGWLDCRFRRRLAACPPVTAEPLVRVARQCAQSLGVKQAVELVETEEVDSPAVYGLRRKRLLLPAGLREEFSPEELHHVLRHELAHIKRRDPELNWLLVMLQTLHWFNPVVWFAFARMRADRELATDELALAHTQPLERRSYGEMILKVVEGLTEHRVAPGMVGIVETKQEIQERLQAIAHGGASARGRWAAGALALVIAGVALTDAREEPLRNPSDAAAAKSPAQPGKDTPASPTTAPAAQPKAGNEATAPGELAVADLPPVVVKTFPEAGAQDVAPGIVEVRITFSKKMSDGCWSWSTAWQNPTPPAVGKPRYLNDHRTCVAQFKLEPGRTYGWWLNSQRFRNFKDEQGRPAVPYLLVFKVRSE